MHTIYLFVGERIQLFFLQRITSDLFQNVKVAPIPRRSWGLRSQLDEYDVGGIL